MNRGHAESQQAPEGLLPPHKPDTPHWFPGAAALLCQVCGGLGFTWSARLCQETVLSSGDSYSARSSITPIETTPGVRICARRPGRANRIEPGEAIWRRGGGDWILWWRGVSG